MQKLDTDDFDTIGQAYEALNVEHVIIGSIGNAETRLMRQRPLVEFAMSSNRTKPHL